MTTVHNGVDLARYPAASGNGDKHSDAGLASRTPIVGTVGSLYPVKGHTYLLAALPDILRRHPDVTVPFVGTDDPINANLEEIVSGEKPGRASPDERVHFSSVGLPILDTAIAAFVYHEALARGVGIPLKLWQKPIWFWS